MNRFALAAGLIAFAGTAATAEDTFTFEAGVGAKYSPAYFGSSDYAFGPSGKLGLPPKEADPGLSVHGSFRFIGQRLAADNPELAGLADVPWAVELGGGVGYDTDVLHLYLDLRQGVGGHSAQMAELGADAQFDFGERLTVTAGPRAVLATAPFFDAYFDVTPAEAAASGFAAYTGGPGLVSVGGHVEARYQIDDDWALVGAIDHDVLVGDAAASPIVAAGSAHQTSVSLVLVRRLTIPRFW